MSGSTKEDPDLEELIAEAMARLERAVARRRDKSSSELVLASRNLPQSQQEPDASKGEVKAGPAARFELMSSKR
jgi:hypothetical protein